MIRRPSISALALIAFLASGLAAYAGQTEPLLLMAGKSGAAAQQGYLGVGIHDLNEQEASALHLKDLHGAEIEMVDHDGPAGKAGLRIHDIILAMDGKLVQSADLLRQMLQSTRPGRTISLLIWRDGQQQAVTATLADENQVGKEAWDNHKTVPAPTQFAVLGMMGGAPPIPAAPDVNIPAITTVVGASYTGAMLETMSPQLAEFFGATTGAGLLVRSVENNSPAANAGIHAGDVIVRANGFAMTGAADWMRTIRDARGKSVPVLILRDKHEMTLSMTPDSKRRSSMHMPLPPLDLLPMPVDLLLLERTLPEPTL